MSKTRGQSPEIKIVYRPLRDLRPNPKNPHKHTDEQVAALAAHMKDVGWTGAILVDGSGTIIAGEKRWRAGMLAGFETAPVIERADLKGAKAMGHLIADNQFTKAAAWDAEMLRAEMADLKVSGEDIAALGFEAGEIEALLAPPGQPHVEEIMTRRVRDRFWISVRGPLEAQASALKQLRKTMAEIPGVSVELGTVDGGA